MSRARSKPVTFFPHVVLNAARAAATARSMSAAEPVRERHGECCARAAWRGRWERADGWGAEGGRRRAWPGLACGGGVLCLR